MAEGPESEGWTDAPRATAGLNLPAPPFLAGTAPVLLLGFALVLLAGFLVQIGQTSDSTSEGLYDTASWFGWIGRAALSIGLLGAAMRHSDASPALRLGLLALGVVVLLGLSGPDLGSFLGNVFSGF